MQRKKGCQAFVWRVRRGYAVLRSATVAMALLVGLAPGCAQGASSIDDEVRLRGTGPYRGQVLDAATKKPIAGAVVVAVWYYSIATVGGDLTRFHDALEVLTDAQGMFVVDAPSIERRAPSRTSFPDFIIFKPGYLYFKGWFTSPEAMAERGNRSMLGVVELKPSSNRLERRNNQPPWLESEIPRDKIRHYMEALGEERKALGLGN